MATKKVVLEKANRLYQLPPPLFSSLHKEKDKTRLKKTQILNLARLHWPAGTPDDPDITSENLLPAGENHLSKLKDELANWFQSRHGADLNPDKEIYIGGGIRNLILNLGLAFIDRGELVYVPELGYPHYRRTVAACGGDFVTYQMPARNDWQPDTDNIATPTGRIARLLFLNSPHNPTGATLNQKEMNGLVGSASRQNILIINDAAYQSLSDGSTTSLLSVNKGKKVGAELYSFSYTFGLPPLAFGFVAGSKEIINGMKQIESLSPQPVSKLYVDLALEAVRQFPNDNLKNIKRQITENYSEAVKLLDLLELQEAGHRTTPFLWAKIPGRRRAITAANILYHLGHITVVPGTEFGDSGEGFLRFSLTAPTETYVAARKRIEKKKRLFKLTEE